MKNKHYLHIVWAKAFDEIYCHHASLFIPDVSNSLFPPELVCVGVESRKKVLLKKKKKNIDKEVSNYLPVTQFEGGLLVPLNSTQIVDAISLNSWSMFKTGKRKELKEFPTSIFYKIDSGEKITLPFNFKEKKTPYLLFESQFGDISGGDKVESKIEFDF